MGYWEAKPGQKKWATAGVAWKGLSLPVPSLSISHHYIMSSFPSAAPSSMLPSLAASHLELKPLQTENQNNSFLLKIVGTGYCVSAMTK